MSDKNPTPGPILGGIRIAGWINEDELPENYPYDAIYPYSTADGVRLFPVFAPAQHQTKTMADRVAAAQKAIGNRSLYVDEQEIEAIIKASDEDSPQDLVGGSCIPLEAYRDELLKVAADLGEPDDPFAAWESVGAMKEELRQWRAEESKRLKAVRAAISSAPVKGEFININQPDASEPVMQQWRCVEQYGPRTGWEDIRNAQFVDWKTYADKTDGVSIEYRNLYTAVDAETIFDEQRQQLQNKIRELCRACETALGYITQGMDGDYNGEDDPAMALRMALDGEMSHLDFGD